MLLRPEFEVPLISRVISSSVALLWRTNRPWDVVHACYAPRSVLDTLRCCWRRCDVVAMLRNCNINARVATLRVDCVIKHERYNWTHWSLLGYCIRVGIALFEAATRVTTIGSNGFNTVAVSWTLCDHLCSRQLPPLDYIFSDGNLVLRVYIKLSMWLWYIDGGTRTVALV